MRATFRGEVEESVAPFALDDGKRDKAEIKQIRLLGVRHRFSHFIQIEHGACRAAIALVKKAALSALVEMNGIDARCTRRMAQDEREVTGERIRDKIAASKAKETSGQVPRPSACSFPSNRYL